MKCPNCKHVSDTVLLKCSACGEAYDRKTLETLQHVEYLLTWLNERAETLGSEAHAQLRGEALSQLDTMRGTLGLPPMPLPAEIASDLALVEATLQQLQGWVEATQISSTSANNLRRYLSTRANDLKEDLAGRSVKVEPPSDLQVLDFALESLPLWAQVLHLRYGDVESLRQHLNKTRTALLQPAPPPAPVPEEVRPLAAPTPAPVTPPAPEPTPAAPSIAPPAPPPKPIPKPPPKPKRPPINWGKVWEKAVEAAVSGALLRGLLYLGAFMIVVSAAILVVLFWDIFPEVVQLAFIAAVPAAFYLAGWGVRSRLELPQAGGVLTGIGALLVAVDFAAVYQFGGLRTRDVDVNAYWLVASLFCTAVYAVTAWRLPGEFFNYITLIGGSNVFLALTRLLNLPLEWNIASVTASSSAMIGGAAYLKRAPGRWGDFALAARRLPQILIPTSLALVLFVPGNAALGQMGTFAFAALGYGLLAWRFPAAIFAHATVWSSIGAVGFAIRAVDLPGEWYATVAAALAPLYILTGQWVEPRLREDFAPRRGYLTAAYLAGFVLVVIAVSAGFVTLAFNLWAGVIALTLAALVLAGCAYLFRRSILVLFAGGLFIAPFTLAIVQWLGDYGVPQPGAWLMAAWAGLALAYLGVAVLLRAAEEYGAWLNLWAHLLAPLASCGLLINYSVPTDGWFAGPTLAALGGVTLVYLASAVIHDSGQHPALSNYVTRLPDRIGRAIFLWPVGFLLPVWLAVFWSVTAVGWPWPWLGGALAGLALAYVGLGQLLARRKAEYRLPPHVYAYALATVAIFVALSDRWALLTTLYIIVGALVALAFVYRRVLETALAALLFLWPFQLALELLPPLTPHAYSLAYALLASLAYMPLGVVLDRADRKFALPVYIVGQALSVYAVVTSLLGRFGVYPQDWPWVGVAVPLVVSGLQVFSVYYFRQLPFAWAAALTFAIAFWQTLTLLHVPPEYNGVAWVGLAFVYLLAERALTRAKEEAWFRTFRWPLGLGATALCTLGLLLTAGGTAVAFTGGRIENVFPLIVAQTLAVGFTVLAARLYRSRWPLYLEPWLAFFPVTLFFNGYGRAIFGQALTAPQYGIVWSVLGLVHLLAGVLLDRTRVRYAHGPYLGGYALSVFAIVWTLADRGVLLWTLGLGILAAVGSALLVHFSRHRTWDELMAAFFGQTQDVARSAVRGAFLWLAAWPFPAWCVLLLLQLGVADGFQWLGFGLPALFLLGLAVWLRRIERTYAWPLHSAAQFYTVAGLVLSAPLTVRFFSGGYDLPAETRLATAFTLLQVLAVVFYAASAWALRWRFFAHVATWLSFCPVTLFFISYGESIFGQALTMPQYGIVWSVLGLVHLLAGVLLDRTRVRYAHGPYLGGYALSVFAIVWTLADRGVLLWTLGLGILAAVGSALLVHFNRHRTWDELMAAFFGQTQDVARSAVRGAFLWLAAWPFPAWCVLLLLQLDVADGFQWLGFGLPALLLLGLAVWLRRIERTYAWPLHSAAQFYTALGLLISMPLTVRFLAGGYRLLGEELSALAFILLQTLAVVFYAASAWALRWRFFAHVAAWLSFFPYTLAWIVYGPPLTSAQFAWPWTGLAAVLLGAGFALDRAKVRYAHGPYLPGYVLAGFALAWSAPERLTNLYTLAADIGLALGSHALVHYGRHRSFDDFVRFFWRKPGTVAQRAARMAFLFFASYAFPVWLAQLLTYHDVPLAWRGLTLALAAPIYVAFGLAVRRVKSEYTWPLYSAGYALTAIGAMVTFDDLALAIYVLALDAVVYAASAYIFQQTFWLYLSNILVPVIALLTLHYNQSLSAPWVGGIFMGLAFLYFGVGWWFDRREETRFSGKNLVSRFALPFYAPGYLLSAVALAVASSERSLALAVYSAGVVLYALSAWAFRESVFLYPAAWLAAVPYYLGMTLTPLDPRWHGLGWLPLIVGYIALGRFVFQKRPLGIKNARTLLAALAHPAMPFYLLAYALSVSMIAFSQGDPLTLTLALAAGAAVYFASAALFRRPVWLYPGLLAAHLALMAHLTIAPSVRPAYYITLPFLGMTWATALMGYGFSRRFPVARRSDTGERLFRLWRWELNFGSWPFVGYLVTPSWAQPFFIFAALDMVFWQTLALYGLETAIILATGNAVLLGLFAMLWQDTALAYGTLAFFLLAAGHRLRGAALPFAEAFAWVGGIGFGLYLLARVAERAQKAGPLAVWPKPLTNAAVLLTAVAVIVTLPAVATHTTAVAAALAFAGALYLAIAYRGRYHRLGYLGMAMLQLAWVLVLIVRDETRPQWYAIPAGLYFTGVGYLERRRRRGLFPVIVESFGLAVLLLTSFRQSLNADGFPYFVLLLVEGLVVIWWGASQRLKVPFAIGLGASALNVVAQVVVLVNVYEVNRWFIFLSVGLLLVTAAVFIERQRERIIARAQEWREELETWE